PSATASRPASESPDVRRGFERVSPRQGTHWSRPTTRTFEGQLGVEKRTELLPRWALAEAGAEKPAERTGGTREGITGAGVHPGRFIVDDQRRKLSNDLLRTVVLLEREHRVPEGLGPGGRHVALGGHVDPGGEALELVDRDRLRIAPLLDDADPAAD